MAARDGIGFCPAYNQTALPCKTAARCRYAPCVNFEALLHSAFKDTIYERMPSAVRLGTSRGRRGRGGRGRGARRERRRARRRGARRRARLARQARGE